MNFRGIEICCPACQADLREDEPGSSLHCQACGRSFPILAGIPDLRLFPDPYIDMAADRAKGLKVAARLDELDFAGLIDYYYSITGVVPPHHARSYKQGLLAGEARAHASLLQWRLAEHPPSTAARVLEIGCGTAPLLVAAARSGIGQSGLAGVDIAFRWLVVAKKRLQAAGCDVPLLCACAEALPFPAGSFDHVILDSTLEHVADQRQTIAECYRVMQPEGHLFVSTPNRYSLGPDPHMGVPAGGFWPRKLLEAYARKQGAIPPKRRLLWTRSLKELLRQGGFVSTTLTLPVISPEQKNRFGKGAQWLISLYQVARNLPLTRHLLFWIGPLLHAVARKPGLATQSL